MEVIIEQAKVIYPGHTLHNKKLNFKIKNGKFEAITSKKLSGSKTIQGENIHLSPGWVDVGTYSGEPGFEHRETLVSLSKAAMAGGYTAVIIFPNTEPILQSKSDLEFIIQKSSQLPIQIYPIGALSKKCEGKELAEMIDMHTYGAVAFSDGKKTVQDTGVLLRALQYCKHFNGLVINQPMDESLSLLGQMHEGKVSQKLGLKGIPEIAETILLKRDIDLVKYTQSRFLSHLISTEEGTKLIAQYKKALPMLASSTSYLNLVFTDESLMDFDSNLKQNPPLRSSRHQKALLKGLEDGVLDIISSNHRPLEIEKKDLEFAYATAGAIGLETCYAAVNTHANLSLDTWVQSVALNPRKIFNLDTVHLDEGAMVDITLFDPNYEWRLEESKISSIAKNSPFIGSHFKGKAVGTYSKHGLFLN